MRDWNEFEKRYRFWVKFGAREFLVWCVCAAIYGDVILGRYRPHPMQAWCAVSLAIVSAAFIIGRFWRRGTTP